MVVNILKKLSRRYFSHYIIKFIVFILIYYVINLNIVSSFMFFNNLYLGSINLMQVLINTKKKKKRSRFNQNYIIPYADHP